MRTAKASTRHRSQAVADGENGERGRGHESIAPKKRNLAIKRGVTPLPMGLVARFGWLTAFFKAGLGRCYSVGKTEAAGQAPQNGRRPTFAIDSWTGC